MEQRYKFSTPVRVRYADTDAQGHVFFSNYLIYFDQGLTDYLTTIGYSYDRLLKEGIDFYYVEALCQFKDRVFFDEILNVHTRIGHIGNTSFTFQFAIFEKTADRFVATGHIVAVALDHQTGKKTPVPQGLREAVAAFEGGLIETGS